MQKLIPTGIVSPVLVGGIVIVILAAIWGASKFSSGQSPSPRPTPTPSIKTTATPTSVLRISELGIQLPIANSMKDLYYATKQSDGITYVSFSTTALTNAGGTLCAATTEHLGPLGYITMSETQSVVTMEYIKQIGNEYLQYKHPESAACGSNMSNPTYLPVDQIDALKTAIVAAEPLQ